MKTQLVRFCDVLTAIRNGAEVLRNGGSPESAAIYEEVAEQLDAMVPDLTRGMVPGVRRYVDPGTTPEEDQRLIERGKWIAACEGIARRLNHEAQEYGERRDSAALDRAEAGLAITREIVRRVVAES